MEKNNCVDGKEYVTVNEFAKRTGRRVNNVYQCMSKNRKSPLPFIKINGTTVIAKEYISLYKYKKADTFTEEMENKLYELEVKVTTLAALIKHIIGLGAKVAENAQGVKNEV